MKRYEWMTGVVGILWAIVSNGMHAAAQHAQPQYHLTLQVVKDASDSSLASSFLKMAQTQFKTEAFIETGTFLGNTTSRAGNFFKEVHTIELSPELCKNAKEKLKNQSNIQVHCGDSIHVLGTLLPKIKGKTLFWLDGHYSGCHAGHDTALGEDNPLLYELDHIRKLGRPNSIIFVDDIRLCDETVHFMEDPIIGGYPLLSTICDSLLKINKDYRFIVMGDILMAYPGNLGIKASPVLQACTHSRFYNGTNLDVHFVMAQEAIIAKAQGEEKVILELLNNTFGSDWHALEYGVARHYILWYALSAMNDGKYDIAYNRLKHIYTHGFDHWRIKFYLAQAAYASGKIKEGESLMKELMLQDITCAAKKK